ncbi:MAG: amidohydrolase family protein, partial [Dehalococcoidia bacterium]
CHATPYWFEPVEILLDQMSRNEVDHATLVQIRGVYDNTYLLECVQRFPGRFAVVCMVDVARPDAPAQLEELVKQGVQGIRLNPSERSPGSDPLALWRKAAELGIVVSCSGSDPALISEDFENLVKEFSSLSIVIEHLGNGGQDAAPPHDTYRRVLALAQYPNTFMKVPGLGEICPRPMPFIQPFPFETIPPLVEMALDAFGPQRLMWGSDFPPVANREGYRNALQWPREHVQFKSEADKEWVFGKTATTLWRFGV